MSEGAAGGTRARAARPGGRVVCVGGAVVDRLLHLLAPAVAGTSNPARAAASYGGVARNVAENLARLGADVALVACVGDDAAAPGLLAHAAAAGVDVAGVRRVHGATTAEYVAVLAPSGDLEIGVAAMDVLTQVTPDDVAAALSRGPAVSWVFLDCNLTADALAGSIAVCRAAGARVAVDAVSTAKAVRLPADLRGVDVLFCNVDEAQALAAATGAVLTVGPEDGGWETELAAAPQRRGAAAVVLTRGPRGPLVVTATEFASMNVVPADAVDVTGAGDALVAGTLAGLLAGQDLTRAVAVGARVAARTVTSEHTVVPDLTPEDLLP
ncbi:PfkB family carbohydrate kinase [Kineosporia sp. R_H_3]|uniref:PfkB family carbohydrate kinase n=1 Tax=Kineosporia sp. R_H_3 TaxID=1961848 RepID=UPI00130417CE|nr:PfkB family carbohydrate kinase [Kineosporia sp. R_H_3]